MGVLDPTGSGERLKIAMTRARMAELMAETIDRRLADSAYTVGLVSALDLVLQATPLQVIKGLSLNAELEDALVGHTGVLGAVLADVLAWGGRGRELPAAQRDRPGRGRGVLPAVAGLGHRGLRALELNG